MKLKPLYISAPSRSGSSLLIKILNCTANMAIVNEPLNSVNISDRNNIIAIFNFIEESLRYNFMMQRVNIEGLEVTDTFPPSKTRWGTLKRSFESIKVVGIKKSFPSFTNKDFFKPFIQQWESFTNWINKDLNGCVVVIMRDPRFTILSWKTTFDALKADTEDQCIAWNLIADTILSSRASNNVKIVRYEDLIQNPTSVVASIANYLGVEIEFRETLPEIRQTSLEDFSNRNGMSVGCIETEIRVIEEKCGKIAKEFGYSNFVL